MLETTAADRAPLERRTLSKAGKVDEVPSFIPAITNRKYQYAMTLNDNDVAYMQLFSSMDNLVYKEGVLVFEGLPATAAKVKNYFTSEGIEKLNLPLLRMFYAILLYRFTETWNEDRSIEEITTIYFPNLAKMMGKALNLGKNDMENTIKQILLFQNIMGIIDRGKKGNDILPVLVYMGCDVQKNTISFASPYMVRVIKEVSRASIRRNEHGEAKVSKSGEIEKDAVYTFLIKSSIAKEKCRDAAEIVFIVVTLIEKAGNTEPHIRASTIINRIPSLKKRLTESKRNSDRNVILKRTFSKAWEILVTQTNVMDFYKDIQLPGREDVPTMKTLDMVFRFRHKGKNRKF